MSLRRLNLVLLLLAAILIIFPLIHLRGADFEGADALAETVIAEVAPQYRPWATRLWEPPSGEIETLLFCLQAAAGAGFIGYYLGYLTGSRKRSLPGEERADRAGS
ncbi:MAG: energy-coupling factor ABC transporter substrate-binding protein [Moorellales bacterium]